MTRFPTAEAELEKRGIEWDSEILNECPDWLRKAYLADVNYCEHIGCKNKDLQVHRLKRGNEGGKYSPDNAKILCSKHHSMYHQGEFVNKNGY